MRQVRLDSFTECMEGNIQTSSLSVTTSVVQMKNKKKQSVPSVHTEICSSVIIFLHNSQFLYQHNMTIMKPEKSFPLKPLNSLALRSVGISYTSGSFTMLGVCMLS